MEVCNILSLIDDQKTKVISSIVSLRLEISSSLISRYLQPDLWRLYLRRHLGFHQEDYSERDLQVIPT